MTPDRFFRELEDTEPEVRQAVLASLRSPHDLEAEYRQSLSKTSSLAGTLCLLKDNIDVAGFPTQASATFLESVRPGPHADAALTRKLRQCGAVIAGKTQMNEFAYGLDGANPHVGDCPNPLEADRCSGGSSSGSAYAVAKGWVPLAFGTDTGGSVRVPAAYCGVYGFRLPPDDWALDGVVPLAPSYDSIGWFTASLEEMKQVSHALLDLPKAISSPLRIHSIIQEEGALHEAVRKSFPGAVRMEVPEQWGTPDERVLHYNVLQSQEAYQIHRAWIDSHADRYSPAVRSLILRARGWTDTQKQEAKAFEQALLEANEKTFSETDVLLVAVSREPAPIRPMSQDQRSALLQQTVPGSLGRNPVLTLPVSTPEGLSLGIQCLLPRTGWEAVLSELFECLSSV